MIAEPDITDAGADRLDDAAGLVAEHARQRHAPRHPGRPVVDLHIGAADTGGGDADPDLARLGRAWLDLAKPQAALLRRNLAKRAHQAALTGCQAYDFSQPTQPSWPDLFRHDDLGGVMQTK